MQLIQQTKAEIEPIELSDMKHYLKIDHEHEDSLIKNLISSSREYIEKISNMIMINQQYELIFKSWPIHNQFQIPIYPISQINSLHVKNKDDLLIEIAPENYEVNILPDKIIISKKSQTLWPVNASQTSQYILNLTAGFGESSNLIPANLRQAVFLLASHWYEHREGLEANDNNKVIPLSLYELLKPYRKVRI